jgi:excisionase family DNA binding protein
MPDVKVLTVIDLANYLRVHRATIYRLLKNRELPAPKSAVIGASISR